MHEVASKMFKHPETAVLLLKEMEINLHAAHSSADELMRLSLDTVNEFRLRMSKKDIAEELRYVSDTIEFLETGVDVAEAEKKDEDERIRLKKELLPEGFTLVRKGNVKRGDIAWIVAEKLYKEVHSEWIGQKVTWLDVDVFRQRIKESS
jgi:hypothetical protein